MQRRDRSERAVGNVREAFRHAGERDVESALLQIGDRSLVRVASFRGDARFAAKREQLAASAANVEQRRVIARERRVWRERVAHFALAAAKTVFESAIERIALEER